MIRKYAADGSGISEAGEFIRSYLEKKGISGEKNDRWLLGAEETMKELAAHGRENGSLSVRLNSLPGIVFLEFSAPGEEFPFGAKNTMTASDVLNTEDDSVEDMLRSRILVTFMNDLEYGFRNGINRVHMTIRLPSRTLFLTLGALLAAALIGALMSAYCPPAYGQMLDTDLLTPVKTIYLNGLKMLAAPVIFFSIASSISRLGNPADLGRIGGKIFGLYLLTTIIAVWVGIGSFLLVNPGNASLAGMVNADAAPAVQTMEVSFVGLLTGIVPDNILSPFLELNILQIIFLAVLCGISIGLIGDYSKVVRDLFEAFNSLFLKMAAIIMRLTPLAVFCSILSLILKMGIMSVFALAGMIFTFLFGLTCMVIIYSILLLISGINPIAFLRSYAPVMLQIFSIAASNPAIPLNMDFCRDRLGISPRIYSFSIPLGATMNMDGMCILLAVEVLTLAKVFGVPVSAGMLLSLSLSIITLSIGAPGVPGAAVIMITMLLTQLGVPAEAVTLVMGIGPLMGMFLSASNCLGDVVVTAAVAKSEKMIR